MKVVDFLDFLVFFLAIIYYYDTYDVIWYVLPYIILNIWVSLV